LLHCVATAKIGKGRIRSVDEDQFEMSEIQNESYTEARQEIEKLRLENSQLMEEMLVYTGLCGQMHRQHAGIEQLKSLLIRAADALENSPSETHFQLVQELRKAAQSTTAT
jgi:hypothetical protein